MDAGVGKVSGIPCPTAADCQRPPEAFRFAHEEVKPCDGVDCSQGFCLLNNAAIAARHALLCHPSVSKVCIIDIDLHHGNGTEEIVRGWTDVMYVSLHGAGDPSAEVINEDFFYPGTATALQVSERPPLAVASAVPG